MDCGQGTIYDIWVSSSPILTETDLASVGKISQSIVPDLPDTNESFIVTGLLKIPSSILR